MDRNKIVYLLGALAFVVMADSWVISPILPAISKGLSVDPEYAAILITAYMIPFGIFQLIFGPLADRFGKKQVISVGITFFTVATGLCAFTDSFLVLGIYRAVTGVFAASVIPVSLALISDIFPVEERQLAIGTFMGIAFLGQGLSMITGGTISYFFEWRGVFIIYALLSLVPLILLLKNYSKLPGTKNSNSRFIEPYLKLLSRRKSVYTYIMIFLEGFFIFGSFSYLGAYISKFYNYNYLAIGAVMTAFGIMSVFGGRIGGKLVLKTGPRTVLTLGLFSAMSANLLIFLKGSNLFLLILSIGLLGLGFVLAHATLLTRATEFAKEARGTVMSLVAFSIMGGGGIGTAIGGKIVLAYGYSALFLIYGLMLSLTLFLSFVLIRFKEEASSSEILIKEAEKEKLKC